MVPNIGPLEIIVVLVVVLLIFGPKRIPQLAKSLGSGLREFKDSVGGASKRDEIAETHEEPRTDATPAAARRPAERQVATEPEPVTAEPVAGGAARDPGRDTVS